MKDEELKEKELEDVSGGAFVAGEVFDVEIIERDFIVQPREGGPSVTSDK